MQRRSVIALVGDDSSVQARVERAVDRAWDDSEAPTFEVVDPNHLDLPSAEATSLVDAVAVVTTASCLTDESVAEEVRALPERVPIIAVADPAVVKTTRRLLHSGVDDIVQPLPDGVERDSVDDAAPDPHDEAAIDPLVDRLTELVEYRRFRVGSERIRGLDDALLDAGTTLMNAQTDEVDTKIDWTIANIGEHADVDRIVCYRRPDDAEPFEPAFVWGVESVPSDPLTLDEFPGSERLQTFGNAVQTVDPAANPAETDDGAEIGSTPPATVHVPLVVEWELIGVVAFETDTPRVWTDEEVDRYRTFGDLIASTLARNERRVELQRQRERLEQFSAVVSHDLRNPLNVLTGYLSMIDGEVSPRAYEAMDGATTRMEGLIDDLLLLARRGDTIGDTEPVPVATVADRAWGSVRAPDATLRISEEIGRIEADPNRLRQVFENLFRNAVEHGGSTVTVEVGSRRHGSELTGVYVADDGPGFPDDARESLFDSGFSTAESSGLGLAIVSRVVDAHGWEIDVRNDDGAVFEIAFEPEPETETEIRAG